MGFCCVPVQAPLLLPCAGHPAARHQHQQLSARNAATNRVPATPAKKFSCAMEWLTHAKAPRAPPSSSNATASTQKPNGGSSCANGGSKGGSPSATAGVSPSSSSSPSWSLSRWLPGTEALRVAEGAAAAATTVSATPSPPSAASTSALPPRSSAAMTVLRVWRPARSKYAQGEQGD